MRIMVVVPSLCRGGAERVASLLTQHWCKEHEVILVLFNVSYQAYPYGGRLINLNTPSKKGMLGKIVNASLRIVKLAKCFRREQPDHVISFMESANFPAIVASLITKKTNKLSISVRANPSYFSLVSRQLISVLYQFPKRVVAVSWGVEKCLSAMGIANSKLCTISNFVVSDMAASHKRPLDAPDQYIVAVGRLHYVKGFDLLLRAFASMTYLNVDLVILGEGEERGALEKLIQSLGIEQRVHLLGAVADPAPWYQHAQCFVLSSRHEGWPNALMEAMNNSCPVISFDCPYGPSEIIESGVSGILVENGDIAALTASLEKVVQDHGLRRCLSVQGKQRAEQFDISTIALKWLT